MKTTLLNFFKGYDGLNISRKAYTEQWIVEFDGSLKTDTIMELVGAGYHFEVQPWSENTLRIIFD